MNNTINNNISTLVPNHIVYELGIETSKILEIQMQDKLKNITWTNGEANIDSEYSELACICCTLAWEIIKKKYPIYQQIYITCKGPDINIMFTYPDKSTSKDKIECQLSMLKALSQDNFKRVDSLAVEL